MFIYGAILPPSTRTYQFEVSSDDGADVYIDYTLQQSQFLTSGGTNTFTLDLDASQAYQLKIKYREVTGTASLAMKWNRTGVLSSISSSYYAIPAVVTQFNMTSAIAVTPTTPTTPVTPTTPTNTTTTTVV